MVKTILLLITGFLPLLGLTSRPPDLMLLIYSGFVIAWCWQHRLDKIVQRLPGPLAFHLFFCFLVTGCLTEVLAWTSNYLKAAEIPALFHPQLGVDLLIGIGFYGGWAAAWGMALRWYRFKLWEVFVITGVQGIFLEQLGAVFLAMVRAWSSNPLLALLFGAYVFTVHGSIAGLALLPTLRRFDTPAQSRSWLRIPLIIALMVGLAFLGCGLVQAVAFLFGGLPAKRSIIAHPFW